MVSFALGGIHAATQRTYLSSSAWVSSASISGVAQGGIYSLAFIVRVLKCPILILLGLRPVTN